MKKRLKNTFAWLKKNRNISIILILIFLSSVVVIYNNRIGIMYYMSRFLGLNVKINDHVNETQKEVQTKPLAFTFKNYYIEVDLDDQDNPYKNVNMDNLIITGGVGEHTVKYELVYTPSSRMVYTVTDEEGNSVTHNQKVTYVVSRDSRNKAMEVFYSIARQYGYTSDKYTGGIFYKWTNNSKREMNLFLASLYTYIDGYRLSDYCSYQFLKQTYYCMLDNGDIKYENYTEIHSLMENTINEYNNIIEKFNTKGYTYRYFIAQVKD